MTTEAIKATSEAAVLISDTISANTPSINLGGNDLIAVIIGLVGAIIGSIITIVAQNYRDREKNRKDEHKNLHAILEHLEKKRGVIKFCHALIKRTENGGAWDKSNTYKGSIFTQYDYEFYFNKLIYVQNALDNSQVEIYSRFYNKIEEAENLRNYVMDNAEERSEEHYEGYVKAVDKAFEICEGKEIGDIIIKIGQKETKILEKN